MKPAADDPLSLRSASSDPLVPGTTLTSPAKLGLLASLYFSQGLPFGFFNQALPVLMRQEGFSLESIGLASLLAIPWALKFLWAPAVDAWTPSHWGRRRGWIIPLQTLTIGLMVAVGLLDMRQHWVWVLAGVLITNLFAATQDIATDGLAVELLDYSERGWGNGIQVAGYRVGMVVGGGLLLAFFVSLGWSGTFWGMAGLLAVAMVPIALYREPRTSRTAEAEPVVRLRDAAAALWRRPGSGTWLGALLLFKGPDAAATAMIRPMLTDRGVTLSELAKILGIIGFTAACLGALVGGWGTGRFGRRPALVVCGTLQAIAVAFYWLPSVGYTDRTLLYVLAGIEHFVGGMATASLFTVMMDACRRRSAATDYTLQACIVVVAQIGGGAISGFLAAPLGYALFFPLSAVGCLLGVGYTAWAYSRGQRLGLFDRDRE